MCVTAHLPLPSSSNRHPAAPVVYYTSKGSHQEGRSAAHTLERLEETRLIKTSLPSQSLWCVWRGDATRLSLITLGDQSQFQHVETQATGLFQSPPPVGTRMGRLHLMSRVSSSLSSVWPAVRHSTRVGINIYPCCVTGGLTHHTPRQRDAKTNEIYPMKHHAWLYIARLFVEIYGDLSNFLR